ncbi:MAG TPA: ABC transporter permease [Tessaracoccus flavescens]|uniref:ABC transporter permease n=1 Tax=Tessaracoccus flavescens TaxID=399497 RepID=A0A921JRN7_9ACTN|nr:ABC transporter permease [Tessaracoccus flavescens]
MSQDPNNTLQNVEPEETFSIEDDVQGTNTKSYSQGQLVRRRFFRHKGAMISLVFLAFIILLAFTSIGVGPLPGWWDKNHLDTYTLVNAAKPTFQLWPFSLGEHPFGQNTIGKDYFALVMKGTQQSLFIAFMVGLLATFIGTTIGAIAGFYRGIAESFLMRMTDLFIIIPTLVLAAVLGRMAGGSIFFLALVLGLVSWTGLARLVRGEVLSLREREFVAAARAVGTPAPRIIVRHILPNALGTIVVNATLLISAAILLETSLSFLGFGVRPPDTSLGLLVSEFQNALSTRPWLFWIPGMFILAIALCVNFIGDGLRDAFDPRQQMD